MDFPYICMYTTEHWNHLTMWIHVVITIDHLCGSEDFLKSCSLDSVVSLQCGETTYSGVCGPMSTTLGACILLPTCDMAARNCDTCAAGATVSHVSHCWPTSVSRKSLSSIVCVTCGVVVWSCVVRKFEETFIIMVLAEKQGVRELFGRG